MRAAKIGEEVEEGVEPFEEEPWTMPPVPAPEPAREPVPA